MKNRDRKKFLAIVEADAKAQRERAEAEKKAKIEAALKPVEDKKKTEVKTENAKTDERNKFVNWIAFRRLLGENPLDNYLAGIRKARGLLEKNGIETILVSLSGRKVGKASGLPIPTKEYKDGKGNARQEFRDTDLRVGDYVPDRPGWIVGACATNDYAVALILFHEDKLFGAKEACAALRSKRVEEKAKLEAAARARIEADKKLDETLRGVDISPPPRLPFTKGRIRQL